MVLRWAASGFLATEKNFRRLMGYADLWILAAALAVILHQLYFDGLIRAVSRHQLSK